MKNRNLRELKIAAVQNTRERDYWKNRFSQQPGKSSFPYDHINTMRQTHAPGKKELAFKWEEPIFSQIMGLSKHNDHALHVVLAAALAALLGKYTGMEDIILATPIYRQNDDAQYINTVLPLRISLENSVTFRQLLGQVKQTLVEAVEHQAYPVELLPELLNIPGQDTGFPLFDVALELENIHPREYLEYMDLSIISRFLRTAGAIEGTIVYDALLYEDSTIERITGHLARFVQNALVNPGTEISTLEILSGAEKTQLLEDFNNTRAEYPEEKTIHRLFEEQAEKTPDQVGLVGRVGEVGRVGLVGQVGEVGQVAITYRQLNEQADHLAGLLIEKGVGAEDIVGLKIDRSIEMIAGILAALKAGGAYMPIDPEYPRERIEYMLKDSGAKVLLATGDIQEEIIVNCQLLIVNCKRIIGRPRRGLHHSNHLAYIIYTSGSTGKPKGVAIRHRNAVNFFKGMKDRIDFSLRRIVLAVTTLSFDISLLETLLPLTGGLKVVIADENQQKDPGELWEIIGKNGVNLLQMTPSRLKLLLSHGDNGYLNKIEDILVGGEAFPVDLFEELKKKYRGNIINVYGPTETTVWSTMKNLTGQTEINIGTPIANTLVYILDKFNRPQPIGIAGELCIGGDGVARGYLNKPELTAEKFIKYRSNGSNKTYIYYCTGDLARWLPDGNIVFLGRIDQQVKIRGFRIETGEIEHQLMRHKDIKAAVATVKEDKHGDKYLCAYIVPKSSTGISLSGPDLSDYLASKLPAYMIPSFFFPLDSIPLTTSGKIDGKALPGPDFINTAGDSYFAPRDQIEMKLAALWSDVLAIEKERIGINDGFFKLGGHSLKANILASKIHKVFHVKLSMMEIFMNPKLKDLAEFIKKANRATYYSIQPTEEKEYYPLSSAQKRLYVLQQMDPRRINYNVSAIAIMEGFPDKTIVENTFKQLIKRHESLRTSFFPLAEEVAQKIHKEVTFESEYYDFSKDQVEHNSRIDARIDKIVKNFVRPFDLSEAPLLRVGLIKTAEKRYVLMVDQHHLISDGISLQVLLKEFLLLCKGETLPQLYLQYKDYSQWQNDLVLSGRIKKQEDYWLNIFKGKPPVLKIPTDYARPLSQAYKGGTIDFEIEGAHATKLRDFAAQENATLFMVMLTICSVFLFKLSGQEDIIIGTTAAGRHHADLENTIGVFINTLALRTYPSGCKTFNDFFKEVKQHMLEAFDNQDYQFEDLVGLVLKERNASRNPLFDVMFGFGSQETPTTSEHAVEDSNSEIKLEPYNTEYNESKFDLLISGVDLGNRFAMSFQYSTQLLKKETAQRFVEYFKRIAAAIASDSTVKPDDIILSTDLETAALDAVRDNDSDFGF